MIQKKMLKNYRHECTNDCRIKKIIHVAQLRICGMANQFFKIDII
jgi:hypothetical protein